MFELRPYQREALAALEDYWSRGGGNPLVSMATATGKSVVIAHLIRDISQHYPALRVLVVTHMLELVEQDVEYLLALWPDAPIGINSAGIGRREWDAPIIFAGVQSVWRNAARLGPRNLVLIDEAHLVPHDGDGMYRSLIAELRALVPPGDMRVAGFSATPFRLDCGRLDEGEGKIFDDVVFDYGIGQGIRDGWLSPLTSKATGTEINISGVGRRGGEFIAGELERAADDSAAVSAACDEIVARGADRRSWLVFCCGVAHAHHVGRRAVPAWHFLSGGDRRDAAPRACGQHRRVQGRHGSVPGQRQRADDRLRRAAGRSPRHVAADAVDRTLRANGRPRHPQGRRQGQLPDPGLRRQLPPPRTGRPGRHQGRRQQRCGRRAGHGAHQDLSGVRRDQPARRRQPAVAAATSGRSRSRRPSMRRPPTRCRS